MTVPTTDSKMYQAMQRQPDDLRRVLAEGEETAGEAAALLAPARRVSLVGIGTSYHAALVGAWLLRGAGCDARAVSSFDFARYPESFPIGDDEAVIVMAHTGVKRYSAQALARANEAGATVLSVGSRSAEHPGSRLILRTVEREQSAAYTTSHLAAMTVLARVAAALGERRGAAGTAGWGEALGALPDQVAGLLGREVEVEPVAALAVGRRVYAAGAGPNEATATELVIKAREAAYGHVDALPIEQFLHGPIVAVNEGDLAVLIQVPGAGFERVGEVGQVLRAIGAELWLVGSPASPPPGATVFALPAVPELLSPLLAVVPMQLLAYQMAARRGINPDTFRRDDPRYAAAFGVVTL